MISENVGLKLNVYDEGDKISLIIMITPCLKKLRM